MKKILTVTMLAAAVSLSAVAADATRQLAKSPLQSKKAAKMEQVTMAAQSSATAGVYNREMKKAPRKALTDPIDTLYYCPTGTFFSAPFTLESDNYYHTLYATLLPPGELTWVNGTAGTDEGFTWYYVDKDTPEEANYSTSEDKDLKTVMDGSTLYRYPAPILTVNGAETGYQYHEGASYNFFGGNISMALTDESGNEIGRDNQVMNYEPFFNATFQRTQTSCKENIESGWTSNGYWTEWRAANYNTDSLAVTAMMEFMAYPGRPYIIRDVTLPAYMVAQAGGKVRCSIIAVTEDGALDFANPLATAEYVFEASQDFGYVELDFKFKGEDDFGLTVDKPAVITGDCYIMVDGVYDDPLITYFTPFGNGVDKAFLDVHEDYEDHAFTGYVLLKAFKVEKDTDGNVVMGEDNKPVIASEDGLRMGPLYGSHYWYTNQSARRVGLYINHYIQFTAEYPFLETEDATRLFMAGEGETKELAFHASESFDLWTINNDEDLPDWLSIEGVDEMYADEESGEEAFADNVTLSITAEPLPEGVEGRIFTFPVELPSQKVLITVRQGNVVEPYVSGTFNEWATDEALKMEKDEETGKYVAQIELAEGGEFKIISPEEDGWKWFGGIDENAVGYFEINGETLNEEIDLIDGSNFKVVDAGVYTLTVDTETMKIVVAKKPLFIVGDVNGDGEVSIADVTMLVDLVLNNRSNERSDVNGDGETGVSDISFLVNLLLSQGNDQ